MQPLKLFFTSGDVFAEFFFYKLTLLDCKVSAEENFVDAALKFEALERVIVCIVCILIPIPSVPDISLIHFVHL